MKTIRIERHLHDMYLYILNRLIAGASPDDVVREVITDFKAYWAFPVKQEIYEDIIHSFVTQAYFYIHKCMLGYEDEKLR